MTHAVGRRLRRLGRHGRADPPGWELLPAWDPGSPALVADVQDVEDEVRRLRERGDLHGDLPAMRCVGYRQVWETLEGKRSPQDLAERGIFATRQLAKRQLTWLRSMAGRQQVAADGPDPIARVVELGLRAIERDASPTSR